MMTETTNIMENRLHEILRIHYNDPNIVIENVSSESACKKGNNFVGEVKRILCVGYTIANNNRKPFSAPLILKTKPDNDIQNQTMSTNIAFKNEIIAYEKIIPLLNEQIEEPITCPKYIKAFEGSILLEDMNELGYKNVPKSIKLNLLQAQNTIQEVAKIHGASLIAEYKHPDTLRQSISDLQEVLFKSNSIMEEKQKSSIETAMAVMETINMSARELQKVQAKLEDLKENVWRREVKLVQKKWTIRVVNHSDIWINNVLFKNDAIALLDWQNVRYTSPALDLTYFMFINLTPELRSQYYFFLLQFYLQHLKKIVKDKIPDLIYYELTMDWLTEDMKAADFFGYMMSIWIMPVFYLTESDIDYLVKKGGPENLSLSERLTLLKGEEKERIVKLTKLFVNGTL